MISSDESVIQSPKKKWYKHKFNVKWLKDPDLKDWLQQDNGNKDFSFSKCCRITLKNANKSMLVRQSSERHKRSFLNARSISIPQYFCKKTSTVEQQIAKS